MAAEFADSVGQHVALPADGDEQTWREIDLLVDELAALARSTVGIPEFYAALVDRLLSALPARGGVVWQFVPTKPVMRIAEAGAAPTITEDLVRWVGSGQAATKDATGSSLIVPPHSAPGRAAVSNPSPEPLVLRLVQPDESTTFLIVLALDRASPPAAQRGAAQLLNLFCEAALDLHQRIEL